MIRYDAVSWPLMVAISISGACANSEPGSDEGVDETATETTSSAGPDAGGDGDGDGDGDLCPVVDPGPDCGNGNIDGDEACDDGNSVDGDGCNTDCTLSGQELWTSSRWGTRAEAITITTGPDRAVYVAGVSGMPADLVVTKLGSEGEMLEEVVQPGTPGERFPYDIQLDRATGELLVIGVEADLDELYVAALSPDDLGLLWEASYAGTQGASGRALVRPAWSPPTVLGHDTFAQFTHQILAVVLDEGSLSAPTTYLGSMDQSMLPRDAATGADGTVFVVGNLDRGDGYRYWVARFDAWNEPTWEAGFEDNDAGELDFAEAVAVGPDGSLVVVGGARFGGYNDLLIRKYSPDGAELWTKVHDETGFIDQAEGVVVDSDGNVVVVGSVSFAKGSDETEIWVAKYDKDGYQLWAHSPNMPLFDQLQTVTVDCANQITVAGGAGGLEGEAWIGAYSP